MNSVAHIPLQATPIQLELPKLLTITQYYDALGQTIGINFLREAVRSGRIRSVSVGRKRLIPRSEVEAWPLREAGLN